MSNQYDAERNFLHPVKNLKPGQLKASQFQTTAEGTYRGTILRQIESFHAGPAHGYKHAIQVLPPQGPPVHIFGSYNEINQLAEQIKSNPDAVMKTIRPLGQNPSGAFYLNDTPPVKIQNELSGISDESVTAAKLYPTMGKENRPLDRAQMESKAVKEHLQDVKQSHNPHPQGTTEHAEFMAEEAPPESSIIGEGS